jgi:hypothetical protein
VFSGVPWCDNGLVRDSGDAGELAVALAGRLRRAGITGSRTIDFIRRDEEWVAEMGPWPMDRGLMAEIASVAAPVEVVFKPHPAVPRRVRGREPSALPD